MGYPEDRAEKFWNEQGFWSFAVFGSIEERGPQGPLKHLEKEVKEALESLDIILHTIPIPKTQEAFDNSNTHFKMELVDCFFLVIDAARRSGLSYHEFMDLAFKKLKINQERKWQPRTSDEPVEHVRDEEK